MSDRHQRTRKQLDNLFLLDAGASIMLGAIALLSPHNMLRALSGGYNHSTHEALRLYGCLRIAVGWILFNVRAVDDGRFRKSICGTLCVCYALQSVSVLRDQLTNSSGHWINWMAMIFLVSIGSMYGRFRFGDGGRMIKIYELPSTSSRAIR